jgi:MFS family permease
MSASDAQVIPVESFRRAGPKVFGILFLLESLVRSFNSSVLSVQAYDLLHSAQMVSVLGTCSSLTVLTITLCMPFLFRRLQRRYAYTTGAILMIAGSLALASFTVPGQIAGVIMRNSGASIANVTLQLYILDNVRKNELTTSEPFRMALSTIAWVIGPYTGVWLYQNYGSIAPQLAAMSAACLLLAVFWYLRLHEGQSMPSGTLENFNPLANLARFARQPRLRLAWAIAFARSCFWGTFFTYGPLLMIESGMDKKFGGLIISISQFLLLSAFIYGPLARKIGVRSVITICFTMIAVASFTAGLLGSAHPILVAALLLVGSLFASGIDSLGAIPFLRAVRPHERQRMAAVYRTFIECSDLIPSTIFIVALHYFDVSIVFIILGASLSLMGILVWRYLPRGM